MALSPDDLEQVRQVVRGELQQGIPSTHHSLSAVWRVVLIVFGLVLGLFAVHVLVIFGFTMYHLMHP